MRLRMSRTTKRGGEVSELDAILKRVWQNGYDINRWDELKAELRAYFGEQIAREIVNYAPKEKQRDE